MIAFAANLKSAGLDVDEAVVFKCQVEGRRTVRRTVYRGVVHKSLLRRTRAVDPVGMPADEELVVVLENGVGGEVDVALIPSDGAIIDEAPTKRLVWTRRQDNEAVVGESRTAVKVATRPLEARSAEVEYGAVTACDHRRGHDNTAVGIAGESTADRVRTAIEQE